MNDIAKRILLTLDAEAFMRRTGCPARSVDAAMHKARYELAACPEHLRAQSRAWLEERGMVRMYGLPFPPEGAVP